MAKKQEVKGVWIRYSGIIKAIILAVPFLMLSTAIYFAGTTLAAIYIALDDTGHFLGNIINNSSLQSMKGSYQYLFHGLLSLFSFGILICFTYFGFYKRYWNISWELLKKWIYGIEPATDNTDNTELLAFLMAVLFHLLIATVFFISFSIYSGLFQDISLIGLRLSSLDEPLNIRNIMIGVFGGISLLILAWRSASADREAQSQEENQVHKRFDDAATILTTTLNKESYPKHLGAIIELRDIAIDNNQFTQRCINNICRCNEWMENYTDKFIEKLQADQLTSSDKNIQETNEPFSKIKLSNKYLQAFDEINLQQARISQEALKAIVYILKYLSKYLKNQQLENIDFSDKMLCGIDLSNASINKVNFSNACMVASNLTGANLEGASFKNTDLRKSRLEMVQLSHSIMIGVKLSEANLLLATLEKVNLRSSNLEGANLQWSRLGGANLKGANLTFTKLNYAILPFANMDSAILEGTNLAAADLSHVSLHRSILEGCSLQHTILQGADLSRATLDFCIMLDCNLYGARLHELQVENIIYNTVSLDSYARWLIKRSSVEGEQKKRPFWVSVKKFENEQRIDKLTKSYLNFIPKKMTNDQLREKVNGVVEKIDSRKKPANINELKKSSLIEKRNSKWHFKKGGTNKVKQFYKDFINNTYTSNSRWRYLRSTSGPTLLNVRQEMNWTPSSYHPVNKSNDASKIVDDIWKILADIKKDLKKKATRKSPKSK